MVSVSCYGYFMVMQELQLEWSVAIMKCLRWELVCIVFHEN